MNNPCSFVVAKCRFPFNQKLYELVLDEQFSQEFLKLQILTAIIDEDYRKEWRNSTTDEKEHLYSTAQFNRINETLPNLRNPIGYTLVNFLNP